jgi:hypothetical protein
MLSSGQLRNPRLNSQTRTAAMINLFARARVPMPGKRGSSTGGGKEERRRLDCRLRFRFGGRWRVLSLGGRSYCSELCERMMICFLVQQAPSHATRYDSRTGCAAVRRQIRNDLSQTCDSEATVE